eukprot:6197886-Prorocentrum_lima.AAC.1
MVGAFRLARAQLNSDICRNELDEMAGSQVSALNRNWNYEPCHRWQWGRDKKRRGGQSETR